MKVIYLEPQEKSEREPLTEIKDTSDGALFTAELPGVAQDAIKLAVSKDILKLEAEGARGRFSTMQALPFEPDPDRISVTFSQGVLQISLKRMEKDVPSNGERQVPVEASVSDPFVEMEKELDRLSTELMKVSDERSSLEERVHFLQRDFKNLKRRHQEEKESIADRKIEEIAAGLVDVLDSFALAKGSIKSTSSGKENLQAMLKGVGMIENQVSNLFSRIGISRMITSGQTFDPNYHEAIGYTEDNDLDDEIVAQEVKAGYLYKSRALRPAQVMVNRKPSAGKNNDKPKKRK